jgi:uncharacterized membrane protein YtjA (UPF0391 family)
LADAAARHPPIVKKRPAADTLSIAVTQVTPPCHKAGSAGITGSLDMLHYAVVFFVIALVAALFGFGGIAASAIEIGKILFVIFAVLAVFSFLFGLGKKR